MAVPDERNGIQKKISTIQRVLCILSDAGSATYAEPIAILEEIQYLLKVVDGYLDGIQSKVDGLRSTCKVIVWNSLGEFQVTPGFCDTTIAKVTVLISQIRRMVEKQKIPAEAVQLLRQVFYLS